MKIAVSCGGTGGHMFPGLAVSASLVSRGARVAVVLSGRKVESERAPADLPAGAEAMCVPSEPFSPRRPLSMLKLARSVAAARGALRKFAPDALLAMGSYTSAAPVLAARSLGVPVVLHEANAVPGAAVGFLSRFARTVCTCFDEAGQFLPRGTALCDTGLPLRTVFAKGAGGSAAAEDVLPVLVMGGSQGARDMNRAVVAAFAAARRAAGSGGFAASAPVRLVHLAGRANADEVRGLWRESGLEGPRFSVEVVDFERDMARRYAEARVCISRAGASSCFELALAGLPAFFVPLPSAPRDHQSANAKAFAAKGAAGLLPQDVLAGESGAAAVLDVLETAAACSAKAAAMRAAMLSLARPDASERVADAVVRQAEANAARRR